MPNEGTSAVRCCSCITSVNVNVGCRSMHSYSTPSDVTDDCFNVRSTTISDCNSKASSSAHVASGASPHHRREQYRYEPGQPFLTVNVAPSPSVDRSSACRSVRGSCNSCPPTPSTAHFHPNDIRIPICIVDTTDEALLDQTAAWSELRPGIISRPIESAEDDQRHANKSPRLPHNSDDSSSADLLLPDKANELHSSVPCPSGK